MTLEVRTYEWADLEIRTSQRERVITGMAVPFDVTTRVKPGLTEVVRRGAFAKSITEHPRIPLLMMHNEGKQPVGVSTLLREDAKGLYSEWKVSRTQLGDEALELAADGALPGMSVGFIPLPGRSQWSARKDHVERREVKLIETSLTPFPAYSDAMVLAVREEELEDDTTCTRGMSLDLARRIASTL